MSKQKTTLIDMKPLTESRVRFLIRGTAPYVGNKMTPKERERVIKNMTNPETKNDPQEPKNFEEEYSGRLRKTSKGKYGIPSTGVQKAIVRAAKSLGMEMTLTKQTLCVEPEGYDIEDGMGLCLISKGKPSMLISRVVVNKNSINFTARPKWELGWEAVVVIRWNNKMLTINTVTALLTHACRYVGFGAGRPFSEKTSGCGWGIAEIVKTLS